MRNRGRVSILSSKWPSGQPIALIHCALSFTYLVLKLPWARPGAVNTRRFSGLDSTVTFKCRLPPEPHLLYPSPPTWCNAFVIFLIKFLHNTSYPSIYGYRPDSGFPSFYLSSVVLWPFAWRHGAKLNSLPYNFGHVNTQPHFLVSCILASAAMSINNIFESLHYKMTERTNKWKLCIAHISNLCQHSLSLSLSLRFVTWSKR